MVQEMTVVTGAPETMREPQAQAKTKTIHESRASAMMNPMPGMQVKAPNTRRLYPNASINTLTRSAHATGSSHSAHTNLTAVHVERVWQGGGYRGV